MKVKTQRKTRIRRDYSGPRCVHCKIRKASQQRNLCGVCCKVPEIRTQYPYRNADTWDGGGGDYSSKDRVQGDNLSRAYLIAQSLGDPVTLPPSPTDALPGSEAKIEVMMTRLALRQSLFHPGDVGCFSYQVEYSIAKRVHCTLPPHMTREVMY